MKTPQDINVLIDNTEPDILPCPFCGCKRIHIVAYTKPYTINAQCRAECANCNAKIVKEYKTKGAPPSKQEATNYIIAQWNRRHNESI